MLSDPYYQVCARRNQYCDGRITLEHAIIYAGRQVNEKWAIIPLCEYHHSVNKHQDGGGLDKRWNEWLAIGRMTEEDKKKYPREKWDQKYQFLNKKYGIR
jgi:hypothetical protein